MGYSFADIIVSFILKVLLMAQSEITTPLAYLSKLGSAVIAGISGGAAGAALGPAGLVVMFFQVMFTGIASAEAKNKMYKMAIAWQDDKIKDMYAYNSQMEELAAAAMLKKVEEEYAVQEAAITQATFIHGLMGIGLILLAMFFLFVLFPKKG